MKMADKMSVEEFKRKLPDLLDHSGMQYKILNPEASKYQTMVEQLKVQTHL